MGIINGNNTRRNALSSVFKSLMGLIITLMLSHSLFSQYFLIPKAMTEIEIVDTASKNENAAGTDVRIASIQIDGNLIPFEALEYDEEWSVFDGILGTVNPQKPVSVTYKAVDAAKMTVIFQRHVGSGIVDIIINGNRIKTVDLYWKDWGSVAVNINLGKVSVLNHLDLFFLLYVAVMCVCLWVRTAIDMLKNDRNTKIFTILLSFFSVCLFIGWDEFGIQENILQNYAFLLMLWLLAVKIYSVRSVWTDERIIFLYRLFTYATAAVVLCAAVEKINGNLESLSGMYFAGNAVVYLAIILILDTLLRRTAPAIVVSSCLVMCFAVANYFVTLFRGSPIVPGDFLVLNTAKNVAANYKYTITWEIFSTIVFVMIWLSAVCYLYGTKKKLNKVNTVFNAAAAIIIVRCICAMEFYSPILDLWNLNYNLKTYGVAVSMVSNIRQMRVSPSEEYSAQLVKDLYKKFTENNQALEKNDQRPNIIMIMNESFSDLSVISDVINSDEIMPYFNSLSENVVSGKAYASTIGGGTANTEYEVLTGNTMAFVQGSVPYQQFVLKNSYSIVRTLKELGYYTAAVHPYYKNGYNRMNVYPRLGFDHFFDIDDFDSPQLSRDRYITDVESYKKVIELFEECKRAGKQAFIFNVTIQNHSDYLSGYWGDQVIRLPGYEGEFPDVEEYLTLMKQSDDALQVLIDYFTAVKEPTVILFFGDHQPNVRNEFYETMKGKSLEDWNLEEIQQRYEIPFMIWANYDIKEKTDVITSTNYLSGMLFDMAGIRMTPYQQFLMKLSEVLPVININGYMGINGQWYDYRSESPYTDCLEDYWNIQYNNMFDRNKVSEWFDVEP